MTFVKILLVENSSSMRRLTISTIHQAGGGRAPHDVLEAEDLESALAVLASGSFDLVLANWFLPDGDGVKLMHMIRSLGNQVPVGFMATGSGQNDAGQPDVLDQARLAGAAFLLLKPIKAKDLARVLDSLAH